MNHYLIEFRFFGKAKYNMKNLIHDVRQKLRLSKTKVRRPIPHMTLVSPFSTHNQRRLVEDFIDVCLDHRLMKFKIDGYGCFPRSKVVYVNIEPSQDLLEFRKELLTRLSTYCRLCPTDMTKFLGLFKRFHRYCPHVTIAMKLSPHRYQQIKAYIYSKEDPQFNHHLIRATLIKNSKILYEYDFLQKRLLNRKQAKNRKVLARTMNLLKERLE